MLLQYILFCFFFLNKFFTLYRPEEIQAAIWTRDEEAKTYTKTSFNKYFAVNPYFYSWIHLYTFIFTIRTHKLINKYISSQKKKTWMENTIQAGDNNNEKKKKTYTRKIYLQSEKKITYASFRYIIIFVFSVLLKRKGRIAIIRRKFERF